MEREREGGLEREKERERERGRAAEREAGGMSMRRLSVSRLTRQDSHLENQRPQPSASLSYCFSSTPHTDTRFSGAAPTRTCVCVCVCVCRRLLCTLLCSQGGFEYSGFEVEDGDIIVFVAFIVFWTKAGVSR